MENDGFHALLKIQEYCSSKLCKIFHNVYQNMLLLFGAFYDVIINS